MRPRPAEDTLSSAAEACEDCGGCQGRCELLSTHGLTMGKLGRRMAAGVPSEAVTDTVARCDVCGACCVGCPVGIDAAEVMTAAREALVASGGLSMLDPEEFFTEHDLALHHEYKRSIGISYEDLRPDRCDAVLFTGCSLGTYAPHIVHAAHAWLEERVGRVAVFDFCCGAPLSLAGLPDRAAAWHTLLSAEATTLGAGRVIAACPQCLAELRAGLEGIEVVPLSTLLREAGVRVSGAERLTVHDSCPDRRSLEVAGDVRALLAGHELVEMEHALESTICCGSGGLVSGVDPGLCEARATRRVREYQATRADHVVTACGHCSHRLDAAAGPGEVLHYLELVFDLRIDWAAVNAGLAALS